MALTKTMRRKLFTKAIEVMLDKGWTKGMYENHGRVCAVGAIRSAAKQLKLPGYTNYINTPLEDFNDKESTRKVDVIVKLALLGAK